MTIDFMEMIEDVIAAREEWKQAQYDYDRCGYDPEGAVKEYAMTLKKIYAEKCNELIETIKNS